MTERSPPTWRSNVLFFFLVQVYDPNFQLQHSKSRGGGRDRGGEGVSAEGKLEQIRVKKLKFTLKDSNYEHAESTRRSSERTSTTDEGGLSCGPVKL